MDGRQQLIRELQAYCPWNEQEEKDRDILVQFLQTYEDAFDRANRLAHITASAWVVNHARDRVLMVYHNIYNSWSWTGGHADGETDLLGVALRECREETGVQNVKPVTGRIYSVEVLTVDGHEKRGEYVSSHLHMNITYLLEADENDALQICEAENSGVKWFTPEEALRASTEPWFVTRIYRKLNDKLAAVTQNDNIR